LKKKIIRKKKGKSSRSGRPSATVRVGKGIGRLLDEKAIIESIEGSLRKPMGKERRKDQGMEEERRQRVGEGRLI